MAGVAVQLSWKGQGLEFDGGAADGALIRVDGAQKTGPSPMQALLVAFAGCMAADMVDIAQKSRVTLTGLDVTVEGERAPEPPRRYTRIDMRITAHGAEVADEPKLQRALDLSREKYCSVLHTLREDVVMAFELVLA